LAPLLLIGQKPNKAHAHVGAVRGESENSDLSQPLWHQYRARSKVHKALSPSVRA